MKAFAVGLIVIIGLGAGYYFFVYKKGNNSVGSSYQTFLQKLKSLGELKDKTFKTVEDVSQAVNSGADKFLAVKDFFEKAPGFVSSTIGDFKNKIPDGALDFLSNPQKAVTQKLSPFIAINGGAATPAKDLEGNICAQFGKNSKVEYSLTNPFSPAKGYQYSLDWGDGSLATGTVAIADPPLFVEHAYAKPGTFSNVFKVTGATSTLFAEIKICVN